MSGKYQRRLKKCFGCKLHQKEKLNRKLLCIKKGMDEVIQILNPRCGCK